jgi:serine/threonine protein kinase/WD40 repeat protein
MSQAGNYSLVAEIVADVLEAEESNREAVVDRLCADDTALRARVLELLAVEEEISAAHPFADTNINSQRVHAECVLDETPTGPVTIGKYRVIREIGRGGMGVVYECEQDQPRRRVAVKLLESAFAAPTAGKRLIQEAEVLGRLRHDGIAQVYDAGVTQTQFGARPFFAMELVQDSRDAADFADHAGLDRRARLELLARIAEAIGHAHAHGIVHRDLKPENILITPDGRPKVLDFGIAHVAEDTTLAATMMTREGQILGTLAYMAPEQLAGPSIQVSAGADVYALGVIGFELLTGRPPVELAGLSISAALRTIEHSDPPRLREADHTLRGDPETIIERCLSREPNRRYANGEELAADIRRHLSSRPVLARPSTRLYRTSRFIRRHRGLSIGLSIAAVVLVVGAVVSLGFAVSESRSRRVAEGERTNARMKELDAIRGVIRGASLLRGRTESWEAVAQLHTIAPSSRGWEWNHEALKLPWFLDLPESIKERPNGRHSWRAFVGDRELVFADQLTGELSAVDIATGKTNRVPFDLPLLHSDLRLQSPQPGEIAAVLKDRRVIRLDTQTGTYQETGEVWPESGVTKDGLASGRIVFFSDPPGVLKYGGAFGSTLVTFEGEGRPTLVLGEDLTKEGHAGPWWEPPTYAQGSPYVVLGRWYNGTKGGRLVSVDLRTHEVVADIQVSQSIPNLAMSKDGQYVYVRSDDGIDVRAVPDLGLVRTIGGFGAMGSGITASPADNSIMFVPYDTGRVVFSAPDGTTSQWPELLSEKEDGRGHSFSRDGRFLITGEWLIDTQSPIAPDARAISILDGHSSYVYQLDVSPDGRLLASAAPEGDILLWDLEAGRSIATLKRAAVDTDGHIAFYLDSPLVFSSTGDSLYFGELHAATNRPGYTRVDLADGARTWTECESEESVAPEIALEMEAKPGQVIYHHCGVLPGDRILHGRSSVHHGHELRIRSLRTSEDTELSVSPATIYAGLAVHPDGHEFAAGEPYSIVIRDAVTTERIIGLTDMNSSRQYGMAYSPDGSRLAIGTEDGKVTIYETEFYKKVADISVPPADPDADRNYVYSLAWTPEGKRLICAGGNTIRILESERPVIRDDRLAAWRAELDAARNGRPSSTAAERVVNIELWANEIGILPDLR